MTFTLYGLAFAFVVSLADRMEKCGQPEGCLCTVPILFAITCLHQAKVFPLFEDHETPGVTEIILRNTQIVGLAPFEKEKWPRLKYLDVRSNPMLTCEVISQLERPGLIIMTDCDNDSTLDYNVTTSVTTPLVPKEHDRPQWLLPVVLCFTSVWFVLVCFLAYKRLKVYKESVRIESTETSV